MRYAVCFVSLLREIDDKNESIEFQGPFLGTKQRIECRTNGTQNQSANDSKIAFPRQNFAHAQTLFSSAYLSPNKNC